MCNSTLITTSTGERITLFSKLIFCSSVGSTLGRVLCISNLGLLLNTSEYFQSNDLPKHLANPTN